MTDYNALRVFLELMQSRSTSKAAKKLGRSQSYVSKVLAQLRNDLNDPLFIRGADGLSATAYANAIAPKLKLAFEQVSLSLEAESFDPMSLERVCLHIAEPYLVEKGKALIQAIRQQTQAVIEMRVWGEHSESLILQGEVDMGLHVISDKPQSLYQKRLHSGSGYFEGNQQGEYVKFIVSGVNQYTNHFEVLNPNIKASICVDNYQLMSQLLDECFTLRYARYNAQDALPKLNLDVALIMKASNRHSNKTQWLMELVTPIINQGVN
ncbi:LysR family transcriptional regulator [Agarivorans sp. Alg241-V36]|uniref:LysR family transcriptional regulator n=1 Tax=Agarivorans sp. Alg241-V36 TaxID=2305992 RepID=UPI0013D5FE95|nr:LysR family transcriptional regulator [Agarivorans sp. Alg241-V36]